MVAFIFNPPADGLDLTMRGTLNVMFDYCSIPLGTYFKLGAQAGSCQISRNRLICILVFATRVKSLILWLRGTKCPKSYIRGTKMTGA